VAIVVVGGHSRSVGKTSVVAGLVRALPEMHWTAVKITQYGHGVCSANGEPCDCVTADHSLAISEERNPDSGTDTARYLAAGAVKSLWVRTQQGQLAEAMPRLRRALAGAENAIIESNSVLQFLRPDVYLSVLDPANPDFKPSALRFLDRADALLLLSPLGNESAWGQVAASLLRRLPSFSVAPPEYLTDAVIAFVRDKTRVTEQSFASSAQG
jgi:molybdopterin-guanine dinucleotide biosynthesis protein